MTSTKLRTSLALLVLAFSPLLIAADGGDGGCSGKEPIGGAGPPRGGAGGGGGADAGEKWCDAGGGQLGVVGVDRKAEWVDRRHAVLPGQHFADLGLLYKAKLHQGIAQAHSGALLLQKGFPELLHRNQPFTDENFTELVLGKGNARRMQLVENEGTNM